MSFEWLSTFHRRMKKGPDYAAKTLAAYALGMKARGAIAGVVIERGASCCEAARDLPEGQVYHPKDAPHLPLPGCAHPDRCECVYRPAMSYPEGT